MRLRTLAPLVLVGAVLLLGGMASAESSDLAVGWCIDGPCFAPVVATGAATNITNTSAVLNGNLLDLVGAASANVSFEWGKSTALGEETPTEERSSTGTFNATLLNLDSNTVYYFRAKAVSTSGTAYGETLSFRTVAVPTLFDTLLPVGLAIAVLFIVLGMWALSQRRLHILGSGFLVAGGIALLLVAFDYNQTTGDIGISILIVGGAIVTFLGAAFTT